MFEDATDCTLAGASHSDVIERMVLTGVSDVEPGSVYLCDTASKRSELVRDEIHSIF